MLELNLYIWINEILILFEEGGKDFITSNKQKNETKQKKNKLKTLCEATGHEIWVHGFEPHMFFIVVELGLSEELNTNAEPRAQLWIRTCISTKFHSY